MLKPTKHHEPLSTAKALVGLLALGIAFVLFWKFMTNQELFMDDAESLRNYVMFTIVVCGFLIGLVYLSSHTSHKVKSTKAKAPAKAKTAKKKKK
jgi:hypothetical protein